MAFQKPYNIEFVVLDDEILNVMTTAEIIFISEIIKDPSPLDLMGRNIRLTGIIKNFDGIWITIYDPEFSEDSVARSSGLPWPLRLPLGSNRCKHIGRGDDWRRQRTQFSS